MTYRNRNEATPIVPTEPAPPPTPPDPLPPPKGPMSDSHEETWTVQKIASNVIGVVTVTLAPDANDDVHKIVFNVSKENAAQYAVGGTHLITIGSRLKFWWETEEEP